MSNAEANETPAKNLLAGYISEDEMAQARGVGVRALRAERQRGDGPPWVKLSRSVWYPEAGFRGKHPAWAAGVLITPSLRALRVSSDPCGS